MKRTWTFQNKLAAGFGVMVLLTAVTAAVAVIALRAAVASKDHVITVNSANLINAAKLDANASHRAESLRGYLLTGEDRFLQEREAYTSRRPGIYAELERLVDTEEENRMLTQIRKSDEELIAAQDRVLHIYQAAGRQPALKMLDEDALPRRKRLVEHTAAFVEREQRLLDDANRQSTAQASLAMGIAAGLAAIALAMAIVIGWLLARALSRQIGAAVQHVQSSSAELQSTASQQAAGARETASSLAEVTSTMNELLITSRQISESAQQVTHIAQETAGAARSGDETVVRMQEAIESIRRQVDVIVGYMLELGKRSQQAGGILEIINELAEQTNILSINATIEAAGAGEAGRRFGVVGEEIRKLSDRVTGSTKEIRGLIDEIRSAVNTTVLATEGGSKAVDTGLRHFEEVTRGFQKITTLVTATTEAAREIELGTKQQMSAVEQVNAALAGAAQASRETETSTTQTVQTATQLANLSHDLSRIVQPSAA